MATLFKLLNLRAVQHMAIAIGAGLLMASAIAQETANKSPMAKLTQAPPGRVIFDFDAKPKAAASAPITPLAGNATATAATAAPTVAPAAPAEAVKSIFWSKLPPASGRSLNDARRMDAPDQGIVIKDAPKATKSP